MKILKAALLGRSLDHSISPMVHRHIFDIVRSKASSDFDKLEYSNIESKDEADLLFQIGRGKVDGFIGFNVTFPYKFAVSNIVGEISPMVKHIRSANTILCEMPLRIISTDGLGFFFAMKKKYPNLPYKQYSLTILGAGGAARAVLHSILQLGWKKITIAARSIEEARRAASPYEGVSAINLNEVRRDNANQFVVQATPVGQRSQESLLENFEWRTGDIAVDLVYNPLRTRFLDRAASGEASILDGLGMLIEQAALSQYFWMTGVESTASILDVNEFQSIYASISKLLTPRWDAFVT